MITLIYNIIINNNININNHNNNNNYYYYIVFVARISSEILGFGIRGTDFK